MPSVQDLKSTLNLPKTHFPMKANLPHSEPERLAAWRAAGLYGKVREKGLTIVPTRLYFKDGRVKVELAVARGKERIDKRRDLAERDAKRQMERALKARR